MDSSKQLQFLDLYTKYQKKIYLFILSMVHRRSDADDLMQQTAAEMWRLFDQFECGSNFPAWGITMARYRILDFRKHQKKHSIFLSEDVYQHITEELEAISPTSEKRIDALRGCLKKLNGADTKLLNMHYEEGLSYKIIAEKLNRSATGIYKVMARIHKNLHDCAKQTLIVWESGA